MAGANPYTEDVVNGARFSGALVNLGTVAILQEFDEQINNSGHADLQTALNVSQVQDLITDYYKGKRGNKGQKPIPKIITKPQYDLLYPAEGVTPNSKDFDLSLLTFMFENIIPTLTGKKVVYKHTGHYQQMLNDLKDLRNLRNSVYMHVSTTAMNGGEFLNNFSKLSNILLKFGIPQAEIDQWKIKTLFPDEVRKLETQIEKLCQNDITFKEEITEKFEKVKQDVGTVKLDVGTVKQDVGTVKQDVGTVKQDMGTVKQDMGEVKQDMGAVKQDMGTVKQDMGTVKQDMGEVKQDVGAVKQDMGTVKQDMGTVKQDMGTVKQDMGEVKQDVGEVKQDVGEVKQVVDENVKKVVEGQEKLVEGQEKIKEVMEESVKRLHDELPQVAKKQRTEKDEKATLEDFKAHLTNLYDQDKYNKIQSLPGECFLLDVSDEDKLMPIDFSAEKLEMDKRELALPTEKRKLKYVSVQVESIEDILEAQQNDDSCRLVLVWADPGCGKSICIKSLVSKFAKKEILQNYSALFYLAVRDIPYIEFPLSDILGCGPTGLGYVPDKYKSILKSLFESEIAMKTLFLVDGIDERTIPESSELFQLIKGNLYPKVKVVITTRPESGTLRSLEPLDCTYKVCIKGTTEAGVYSYLEKGISSEGKATKQVVDHLITKCKEQMLEFHLLKVPLYLTIVRYILIDFYNKHSSFKDYRIPKTATDLFKVMIHIFLRVWVERVYKKHVAQSFNFKRSPLDQSSTLPNDMKRVLRAISKMSYFSLQKQIYEFNNQDFNNYFIDADQVIHSGLFCFSPNKEGTCVFFRHKQMIEFMAGMYLASKKMGDQSFDKRMTNAIKNTEKQTLMDTFKGVESMMFFTFGLCPEFAVEILDRLKGHICVAEYGGINVHYEFRLFVESDNKQVSEAMRRLLVESPLVRKYVEYKSPVSIVNSLFKGLTLDQNQTLLWKWYGLTVYRDGEGWGVYNGKIGQGTQGGEGRGIQEGVGDSGIPSDMGGADHGRQSDDVLVIRDLNDVYYFILHHCQFNNVKSVKLEYSDISDVNKISRVFPLVQQIDLGWSGNTELDEFMDTEIQNHQTDVHKHTSTLRHVQISGHGDQPFPSSSVLSLIQQTELQSLTVKGVDIFSDICDLQGQILWSKLLTLEVMMGDLTDENCSGLSVILQCTPRLQSLTWCYKHNQTTHNKPWEFLVEARDKLPNLKTLRLGQYVTASDSPTDPSDIQPLWTTLQTHPKLTTLGLGLGNVEGREAEWVGNIIKYGQYLNKVQIMHWGLGGNPDTVIQEVQRQITQCDPQSTITVEGWESPIVILKKQDGKDGIQEKNIAAKDPQDDFKQDHANRVWNEDEIEHLVKTCSLHTLLAGETGFGKSSIARSLLLKDGSCLTEKEDRTRVLDCWSLEIQGGTIVIYDPRGHEAYQVLCHLFHNNSEQNLAMITHRIDNKEYHITCQWLTDIVTRSPKMKVWFLLTQCDRISKTLDKETLDKNKSDFINEFIPHIQGQITAMEEIKRKLSGDKLHHVEDVIQNYKSIEENLRESGKEEGKEGILYLVSCEKPPLGINQLRTSISNLLKQQDNFKMKPEVEKLYKIIGQLGSEAPPKSNENEKFEQNSSMELKANELSKYSNEFKKSGENQPKTKELDDNPSEDKGDIQPNPLKPYDNQSTEIKPDDNPPEPSSNDPPVLEDSTKQGQEDEHLQHVTFEALVEKYEPILSEEYKQTLLEESVEEKLKEALRKLRSLGLILWYEIKNLQDDNAEKRQDGKAKNLQDFIFNDIKSFVNMLKSIFLHDKERLNYENLDEKQKPSFENKDKHEASVKRLNRGRMDVSLLETLLKKSKFVHVNIVIDLLQHFNIAYKPQEFNKGEEFVFFPWYLDSTVPDSESSLAEFKTFAKDKAKDKVCHHISLEGHLPCSFFHCFVVRVYKCLLPKDDTQKRDVFKNHLSANIDGTEIKIYHQREGGGNLKDKIDVCVKSPVSKLEKSWEFMRECQSAYEHLKKNWWYGLGGSFKFHCPDCPLRGETCNHFWLLEVLTKHLSSAEGKAKCETSRREFPDALVHPLSNDQEEKKGKTEKIRIAKCNKELENHLKKILSDSTQQQGPPREKQTIQQDTASNQHGSLFSWEGNFKITEKDLLHTGKQMSRAVCQIMWPKGGGIIGSGTGFLVGSLEEQNNPGTHYYFVMTCEHLLPDKTNHLGLSRALNDNVALCTAEAVFCFNIESGDRYPVKIQKVIASDSTLDYALLCLHYDNRLDRELQKEHVLGQYIKSSMPPAHHSNLVLIGHPEPYTESKTFDCSVLVFHVSSLKVEGIVSFPVTQNDNTRLFYKCSSLHSASGSPCFDLSSKILYVMHQGGVEPINPTARSNTSKKYEYEYGGLLFAILKDLKDKIRLKQCQHLDNTGFSKLFPGFK